jgi:predicted kinase
VLRSDVIRKSLFNVPATRRLGPEGYTPSVTERVYTTACERAATILEAGHAAIVDATFSNPGERRAISDVARRAGAPFVGLWLEAPVQVLMDRLTTRQADASDATVDVLHQQLAHDESPLDWNRLDSSESLAAVQRSAEGLVRERMEAVR